MCMNFMIAVSVVLKSWKFDAATGSATPSAIFCECEVARVASA